MIENDEFPSAYWAQFRLTGNGAWQWARLGVVLPSSKCCILSREPGKKKLKPANSWIQGVILPRWCMCAFIPSAFLPAHKGTRCSVDFRHALRQILDRRVVLPGSWEKHARKIADK